MKGKENSLFWIFKLGQKNRVKGKFVRLTSFVETYALLFNLYPGITNLPEPQSITRAEEVVFRELKLSAVIKIGNLLCFLSALMSTALTFEVRRKTGRVPLSSLKYIC